MSRKLLVLLASLGVVVWFGCTETAPPAPAMDHGDDSPTTDMSTEDPKAPFVGNWELVRVELRRTRAR